MTGVAEEDILEAGSGDPDRLDAGSEAFHQPHRPLRTIRMGEADLTILDPRVANGEFLR